MDYKKFKQNRPKPGFFRRLALKLRRRRADQIGLGRTIRERIQPIKALRLP